MQLLDIQKAISRLLYKNFSDCEIIADEQVADVENPTFFISTRPIKSTTITTYNKDRVVNVDIYYVQKENEHRKNLEIADKLDDIFSINLKVNDDEYLDLGEISFSEPDFLICSFTLRFRETIPDKNEYKKMKELVQKY